MKLTFISLCFAAGLCVANAQSSASSTSSGPSASTTDSHESIEDQLRKARAEEAELLKNYTPTSSKVTAVKRRIIELEKQRSASSSVSVELANARNELAMLQLKYKDNHPLIIEQKNRISALEKQRVTTVAQNSYGAPSSLRLATRLNTVVRRANTLPAGSIILNAPLKAEEIDELAEDLNVFKFLINRHLERTFGDQATEYRLGVPITMSNNRMVQLDYVQDFGLLAKVFVPFPVAPSGEPEKKIESTPRPDTDWEKARRALFGGDTDASGNIPGANPSMSPSAPAYDEKLVTELKTQMLQALKNAANLRHVPDDQTILLALIGAANPSMPTIDPVTGLAMQNADAGRSTILTIRVKKNAAAAGAKDEKAFEKFTNEAQIISYIETAPAASPPPMTGFGGAGYGMFPGAPATVPLAR